MERITYKQKMSGKDFSQFFWSVMFPVSVIICCILIVDKFGRFGTNLMAPMIAGMWGTGALCAVILPSHRKGIIGETHWTILGYLFGLLGMREVVKIISGTTSQMLMATYNQAMPQASGASLEGFVEYMLWIVAVMVPLSFIVMQAKKLLLFKRNVSKQKIFDQLRNLPPAEGRGGR